MSRGDAERAIREACGISEEEWQKWAPLHELLRSGREEMERREALMAERIRERQAEIGAVWERVLREADDV